MNDDGEIWYRCEICAHEQEENKPCDSCGEDWPIAFVKKSEPTQREKPNASQ
jgi:rRNA maturation endonuclease Nob1